MQDIRSAAKRSDSGDGALVCSLIAAALAGIAILLRSGFPDLLTETVLRSLGLSWYLLNFPWLVWLFVEHFSAASLGLSRPPRFWFSESFTMLAGLALTAFLGWACGQIDNSYGFWIALTGGVLLAARLMHGLLQPRKGRARLARAAILLTAAGFLSLYSAGAIWGSGYQNPLFIEGLAGGMGHIDTLFHATLSNMIRTHGVPSTGLDGLPFLHYHFGSHWLFAMFCNLLGISVIDFYNVGYAIVVVPFLIQSIVVFANENALLSGYVDSAGELAARSGNLRFWFVICLGFAGILPLSAGYVTSTARTSILVSESYAVGVALSLLTISSAHQFFRTVMQESYQPVWTDWIAAIVAFPLLLAAIGLTKISILLILAVAGLYAFARVGGYRSPILCVTAVALLIAAGISFRLAYSPGYGNETGLQPLGFLRGNVEFQWWGLFWIAYFAWFWIAFILRVRQEGIATVGEFLRAVRERKLIDIELLSAVALAGVLPGMLLSQWSSTHFFSDYQNWLALGLVLSLMLQRHGAKAASAESSAHAGWRGMSLARVGAAVVCVLLGGTMLLNTASLARQMMNVNLASRGFPAGNTGVGSMIARGKFSEANAALTKMATDLRATLQSQFQLLETLREFDRMPLWEKKETALHISKSNSLYWELTESPYTPQDVPFVAPALSGLMMVDGLYLPRADDRWSGYGYQTYPKPSEQKMRRDGKTGDPGTRRSLCDRARQLGCRQLLELGTEAGNELEVTRTVCE